MIVAMSDERPNPDVCLKVEGAQPGNPVCSEIDKASWNGQWGDGSKDYPWPMVTVKEGTCYRLRFIGMMGQAQNFQISISGNYLMSAVYDLATFLETAPSPNMPKVDSSKFWAFLHYEGHDGSPGKASHKLLGGYNPPKGTGGGEDPAVVSGPSWNTNLQSN